MPACSHCMCTDGLLQDEEDAYLRELAGVDDLTQAVSLQAVINTATSTVSHLGAKLPSLQVCVWSLKKAKHSLFITATKHSHFFLELCDLDCFE